MLDEKNEKFCSPKKINTTSKTKNSHDSIFNSPNIEKELSKTVRTNEKDEKRMKKKVEIFESDFERLKLKSITSSKFKKIGCKNQKLNNSINFFYFYLKFIF